MICKWLLFGQKFIFFVTLVLPWLTLCYNTLTSKDAKGTIIKMLLSTTLMHVRLFIFVCLSLFDTRSKHIKGSKERLFIMTRTQPANFRGNPLCQVTKRHLNNSLKTMKNEFWVFLFLFFG